MTLIEQMSVIRYGEKIDVKVTPYVVDGVLAVAYRDSLTKDYFAAMGDLHRMKDEICSGEEAQVA